ncbi:Alcohol dehydrogenase zinc-binding domain protein (plasmid) [Haloterrigena turkmenica DSM 5511]|uniref:Alcohol dehydrogenase zinc-binding domain protein n=1 Tax=Haloterrigena turkmenica (strain ATCC 51198 / DSM 5511 / JCM 9101 / NCIMB 13204 / VKM B-1734 / 4k) TaxID=543526 RepID=D2S1F4_HALTV|nr:2,3-butanediol dehydrogenase [Haloterrigena turkmenica]ADB63201.1 Alcohol dehydrogenase zinc-binding domain protein [Haloterrigena turkmenica DSM 5511]
MKAARFYGERDIRIDEDADPGDVGPTDVRIDVDVCGICGTDLHEYERAALTPDSEHPQTGASRPIVIGHEFSGRVSEVGDDVMRLAVGDPVTVHPNIPCHDCVYCADGRYNRCDDSLAIGLETGTGGFAESAVVPARQVHVLPESVDLWEGALVEPLAVGLHAVRRSGMCAGDTVAVFGCGPIGLTALRAAEAGGAKRIFASEPNEHRREVARRLGADVAIDPLEEDAVERIADATDDGVDAAFEFAGVEPSVDAAIRSTRRGGAVTVGSLSDGAVALDLDEIVLNERELRGTFCYGFPPRSFRTEFDAIVRSIADGEIDTDAFATKRISLENIVEEGFEELTAPDTAHVKILVEP